MNKGAMDIVKQVSLEYRGASFGYMPSHQRWMERGKWVGEWMRRGIRLVVRCWGRGQERAGNENGNH